LNSNVVQSIADDTNITGSIAAQVLTLAWSGTLAAGRLNSNVVQAITNDTNITGSISAQDLTLGWTGTLAAGRLNSNVVQSIVDDTNITGTIAAQALTLGWSGTLGVARGGLGGSLASTGGASQVLKQVSTGAAITVGQLAASDLSNGTSGTGAVVLENSPTFTGTIAVPALEINGTPIPASVVDFSIACFAPGLGTNGQVLTRVALAQSVTFPSGAGGSYAVSDVLATSSTTYSLSKNGTSFATVVFTSASLVGTWTQASSVTFSAGDILKVSVATADSTLSDVGITLAGTKN
jgi:hypothetical protein